jgi:glycosyltransferase involved in cell wall biosynthesis
VPTLSIVVPVFNEEACVAPFLDALGHAMHDSNVHTAVIFVDDGSTDSTAGAIRNVRPDYSIEIFLVRFARNFGKEAAICAGLDVAAGDAVVVMDIDLQDPPALVPAFVERWRQGADIVYGARRTRDEDSWAKRASANAFYRVFNRMAHRAIPPDAGDFRLMDRRVVEVLRLLPERSRFTKGLFAWPGFRVESVAFDRPARVAGESRWSPRALWSYGLNGVFNFSSAPLRIWSYAGAVLMLAGLTFALIVLLQALVGDIPIPGYASTIILIVMLGGLQIIGIGMLGEYLGRTFDETKRRPLYVVAESDVRPNADTARLAASRPEIRTFSISGTTDRDRATEAGGA